MKKEKYEHIKTNINLLDIDFKNGIVKNRKSNVAGRGYLQFHLRGKKVYVHQVIAFMKFKEKAIGLQVNHIDGNKKNNKPSNLEMVSSSENNRHAFKVGLKQPTVLRGHEHPRNKLTKSVVLEVKTLLKGGMMQKEVAEVLGIHKSTVGRISRGEAGLYV